MLNKTDRPEEPTGIKPRIVLRAPCLLKAFESVCRRYRPTGYWYYIKDPSGFSLEISHRNEAPIYATKQAMQSNDTVIDFLQENILPLFGPLTDVTYEWYIFNDLGLIWVLLDLEGHGDVDAAEARYRPAMTELAVRFKARYYVGFVDTSLPQHREWVLGDIGVTSFPAVVVQRQAGLSRPFVYTGPLATPAISQFVHDVEDGCLNYEHPLLNFDGHLRRVPRTCRTGTL